MKNHARTVNGKAEIRPARKPAQPHTAVSLHGLVVILLILAVVASMAAAAKKSDLSDEVLQQARVARGEYLVTILGCSSCHTEGGLENLPYGPPLAGSKVGIAYSDPAESNYPGIVYAANLTPHKVHGLGLWSHRDIVRAIRNGINHRGGEVISVMPWLNYNLLTQQDTDDIAHFLRSLPPIDYQIPENVPVGEPSLTRYLRIGVYSFTPFVYLGSE